MILQCFFVFFFTKFKFMAKNMKFNCLRQTVDHPAPLDQWNLQKLIKHWPSWIHNTLVMFLQMLTHRTKFKSSRREWNGTHWRTSSRRRKSTAWPCDRWRRCWSITLWITRAVWRRVNYIWGSLGCGRSIKSINRKVSLGKWVFLNLPIGFVNLFNLHKKNSSKNIFWGCFFFQHKK